MVVLNFSIFLFGFYQDFTCRNHVVINTGVLCGSNRLVGTFFIRKIPRFQRSEVINSKCCFIKIKGGDSAC